MTSVVMPLTIVTLVVVLLRRPAPARAGLPPADVP
jgi:hypothetical protein